MTALTISDNASRVLSRLRESPRRVREAVNAAIGRNLLILEGKVQRGSDLRARRGSAGLFGRLTSFSRLVAGEVDAAIGFRKTKGFPYELSQEFGAQASPGKAMAIPLTPMARALSDRGMGPRQHPQDLALVKVGGRAFLMPHRLPGKAGRSPEYILVLSIPARLHFRRTVAANLPKLGNDVVRAAEGAI